MVGVEGEGADRFNSHDDARSQPRRFPRFAVVFVINERRGHHGRDKRNRRDDDDGSAKERDPLLPRDTPLLLRAAQNSCDRSARARGLGRRLVALPRTFFFR